MEVKPGLFLYQDERDFIDSYCPMFTEDGFDVQYSDKLEEAIEKLINFKDAIRLVLVDLDVEGEGDGDELVRRTKMDMPSAYFVGISGRRNLKSVDENAPFAGFYGWYVSNKIRFLGK